MPRIPTYEEQNTLRPVSATPQRGAPVGLFTAEGEQQQAMGQGLMKAGDAIGGVALKEIEKVNEARIHEKYSLLAKAVNDSIYGEKGVLSLQGSSAVGAADKWNQDFDRISGEVTQDLNPVQRQMFERYRLSLQRGAYTNVLRHEVQQARAFQDASFKNLVSTARETAGLNFADTPMVNMQIEIATEALRKRPEYTGASSDVKATMEKELRGGFHAQVIESALTARNTSFANTYMEQVKGELPLDLRNKIEARLKPATDFEEGRALALEVQDKIRAGTMTISEGERFIIEKAKSKEAAGVAQSVMREMQDAQRRETAVQAGSFVERFERTPNRATMNAIMGDPAFLRMEADQRASLLKYFRQEIEQADDRFRARQNEQTPDKLAAFYEALQDPNLGAMSPTEINGRYATTLGRNLTAKLVARQKELSTAAGKFQIDRDILNEAVPKDLTKPSKKQELHAFRGIVESRLADWKAANPGKLPTLEEQKQIANSANEEWISVGTLWNSTLPAYRVQGDKDAMPAAFYNEAKAWAQRNGRRITDDDILRMWQTQQARDKKPK